MPDITIHLTDDHYAQLRTLADFDGRSVEGQAESVIRDYLAQPVVLDFRES